MKFLLPQLIDRILDIGTQIITGGRARQKPAPSAATSAEVERLARQLARHQHWFVAGAPAAIMYAIGLVMICTYLVFPVVNALVTGDPIDIPNAGELLFSFFGFGA